MGCKPLLSSLILIFIKAQEQTRNFKKDDKKGNARKNKDYIDFPPKK
jgi:hypothetical protein